MVETAISLEVENVIMVQNTIKAEIASDIMVETARSLEVENVIMVENATLR